jgi:hypothetical protein
VKKLFVLVAVAVLMLAASCDSKNGGPGWPALNPTSIVIAVPAGMVGNANADWSVTWVSNKGPFTVAWDFGNGANPNTVSATATATNSATTVQMLNATAAAANYTATVTITDVNGRSGSATANYTVGIIPNLIPTIASAVYTEATRTLVVTVNDADDAQTLTVGVTVPAGLTVDAASKAASQTGPLTASFVWGATDAFAGGNGDTTITVTDQDAGTATGTATITIPAITLEDDTIYAIPMANTAAQADTVTILVATGVPANAFQYMVGANVTFPTWVHYAANTFNIGAVGGVKDASDGIWGPDGMNVASFLTGTDAFLFGQEKDFGTAGRWRLETNVTPLSGTDITTESGALCNFGVTFDQAGTATFGFIQATGAIDRTYYRDGANNDYYWGTLMAGPDGVLNVTGVSNEIVVN